MPTTPMTCLFKYIYVIRNKKEGLTTNPFVNSKGTAEHMSTCGATQVADAGLTRRWRSHLICPHSSVHSDLHTCSKLAACESLCWLNWPCNLTSFSQSVMQLPARHVHPAHNYVNLNPCLIRLTCRNMIITWPRHNITPCRTMVQSLTSAFYCRSHAHTRITFSHEINK